MQRLPRFLMYALIWAVWVPVSLAASEESALDALFAELKASDDLIEMAEVQNQIWARWYALPDGAEHMQAEFDAGMRALGLAMPMTAIDHFTTVIDEAPEFAEAWNRRATTYFMIGDFESSLRDIQETLIREPRHFGAISGLSMIFEQNGDLPRALAAERMLLELIPNDPRIQARVQAFEKALGVGQI